MLYIISDPLPAGLLGAPIGITLASVLLRWILGRGDCLPPDKRDVSGDAESFQQIEFAKSYPR